MSILQTLNPDIPAVISVAGGGGKTSFIFTLAREAADRGYSVLVTTTTAMFNPGTFSAESGEPAKFHRLYTGPADAPQAIVPEKGRILVAARNLMAQGKKLKGYDPDELGPELDKKAFDLMLIEADGARMRPVKAPADHEPVIPPQTRVMAGCIGLDCLDRPLDETYVHRPELLALLSGQPPGSPVTEQTLAQLISHENGLFKSCPPDARRLLVLNKADTPALLDRAKGLIRDLAKIPGHLPDLCLVTRLNAPHARLRLGAAVKLGQTDIS